MPLSGPDAVGGAGDATRTHDLLITNQLHYRLCYTSINLHFNTYNYNESIISYSIGFVNNKKTPLGEDK